MKKLKNLLMSFQNFVELEAPYDKYYVDDSLPELTDKFLLKNKRKVKNLNLYSVNQRSELLIDFLKWYWFKAHPKPMETVYSLVDRYLKSINCG